jgi:hypothetical protein
MQSNQVLDGDHVVMLAQATPPTSAAPPLFIRQNGPPFKIAWFDGSPCRFSGFDFKHDKIHFHV